MVIVIKILLLAFMLSCQHSKPVHTLENGIVINLDVPDNTTFKASDIFKGVQPIILETKPESLIARISELQVFEDYLFVLDRIGRSLIAFSREGKFIRRIGGLGRGSGEFSTIEDFTVDPVNRLIYIMDRHIVHKYTIDGVYINSLRINVNNETILRAIQYFDGYFYFTVAHPKENDSLLIQIDPVTGGIVNKYLNLADRKYWNGTPFEPVFFNRLHGIPKYTSLFMESVVSLDDISKCIIFESKNFPTTAMIDNIKKQIPHLQLFAITEMNKITGINSFLETTDFIFIAYNFGNRLITSVFCKKENQLHNVLNFNNLVFEAGVPFKIRCADNNGVFEIMEVEQLLLCLEYGVLLIENQKEREPLLAINEDSNPIIFYYEFK